MQNAYFMSWTKALKCFFLGQDRQLKYTLIRQLLQELSDQGKLYLQMTSQVITRADWVNGHTKLYTVEPVNSNHMSVNRGGR